jgi:hypothetical protein
LEVEQQDAALSLLFAAGDRPSAEDVERALSALPGDTSAKPGRAITRITDSRKGEEGWLELLASGMTFDLTGLAPAVSAPVPAAVHFFGLPAEAVEGAFEAIEIVPGPHLEGGGAMMPVVRTMASVASALAAKLGAQTVCWAPARSWMDPSYFARIVDGWLNGGAFPALGFTGIERSHDGSVESDGLAYFTGQELRVDARRGEAAAATVKLAVRAIDHLVRHGRVERRERLTGPDGEALLAEPSAGGRIVRLWREG